MRWDSLFDDLEGQLESEWGIEDLERHAEEERLRIGRLSLRERLLALASGGHGGGDRELRLRLRRGRDVRVIPRSFGRDWIAGDLVREHGRPGTCIVRLSAIVSVLIAPAAVRPSLARMPESTPPGISERIGLAFALRDLCRRRGYVTISGAVGEVSGTIDRVARDHFDVAVHGPGTPRREREVSQIQIISIEGVDLVEV